MPRPELTIAHRRRLLTTAKDAAARVGALVGRRFRPSPRPARRKGVGDFVTEADLAGERELRRVLLARWPEHGFIGEETAPVRPEAELVWVVDPIDGTSNFAQGLATWGVSVACVHRGSPVAAAVFCAPEGVVFAAARGLGATRAGRRTRVPEHRLGDATVVGAQWHRGAKAELAFVQACVDTGARVRTFGSTVTHLCDVASGRLHANVQQQGRVWDFAAAALIVTEAGGRFTGWDGRAIFPIEDLLAPVHFPSLAAGPRVHRALVGRLRALVPHA